MDKQEIAIGNNGKRITLTKRAEGDARIELTAVGMTRDERRKVAQVIRTVAHVELVTIKNMIIEVSINYPPGSEFARSIATDRIIENISCVVNQEMKQWAKHSHPSRVADAQEDKPGDLVASVLAAGIDDKVISIKGRPPRTLKRKPSSI